MTIRTATSIHTVGRRRGQKSPQRRRAIVISTHIRTVRLGIWCLCDTQRERLGMDRWSRAGLVNQMVTLARPAKALDSTRRIECLVDPEQIADR